MRAVRSIKNIVRCDLMLAASLPLITAQTEPAPIADLIIVCGSRADTVVTAKRRSRTVVVRRLRAAGSAGIRHPVWMLRCGGAQPTHGPGVTP